MLTLDHLAVAGATLADATNCTETALGVKLQPGGEHAVFHTHNTLLGLEDGLYLEAIAVNPDAPTPDRPRWFDLDRFSGPPRLTNWICRTDDLDAAVAAMPYDVGAPVSLQRGDLRWRMAVPANGVLPFDNCFPALMQWDTDLHPASRLNATGIALETLTITHPQAEELGAALKPFLSDTRITMISADTPGLKAQFQTPAGPRSL